LTLPTDTSAGIRRVADNVHLLRSPHSKSEIFGTLVERFGFDRFMLVAPLRGHWLEHNCYSVERSFEPPSDYLLAIDPKTFQHPIDNLLSSLRLSDHIMACCHVGANVYGIRSRSYDQPIFDRIMTLASPQSPFILAPISDEWIIQNGATTAWCFRPLGNEDFR
jgi:hypothetical protein